MDRFIVTYRIVADDAEDALSRAEAIALEDTVEIPRDVVPKGYVEDTVLGRVENLVCIVQLGDQFLCRVLLSNKLGITHQLDMS